MLCSNAKRFFRTSFALELRRPLLCYTKLTELLHDARFRDMCTVELQAQGYMVAPATGDRRQINLSLRFLPRLVGCHASSARTSPCALKTRRPRLRGRLFLVVGVVYCHPRKTLNRRRTRGGPLAAGAIETGVAWKEQAACVARHLRGVLPCLPRAASVGRASRMSSGYMTGCGWSRRRRRRRFRPRSTVCSPKTVGSWSKPCRAWPTT